MADPARRRAYTACLQIRLTIGSISVRGVLSGERAGAVEEAGTIARFPPRRLDRRLRHVRRRHPEDARHLILGGSRPATSMNSVFTGPGQTAVRVTPVPWSSSCTASLRLSTNAFVAA